MPTPRWAIPIAPMFWKPAGSLWKDLQKISPPIRELKKPTSASNQSNFRADVSASATRSGAVPPASNFAASVCSRVSDFQENVASDLI